MKITVIFDQTYQDSDHVVDDIREDILQKISVNAGDSIPFKPVQKNKLRIVIEYIETD